MRYVKVDWHHHFDAEPVVYFSEIAEDGFETRKVQVLRDGRSEWADQGHETASVGLSEIPFPVSVGDLAPEDISAEEISAAEFEQAWMNSHASE